VGSGTLDGPILDRAVRQRGLAHAYIQQEGLQDPVAYALVDLGWHGRLQRSLSKILSLAGDERPVHGYYFGLLARVGAWPRDTLQAYFWDRDSPSTRDEVGFQTRVMMEVFTAADHGGVQGYSTRDGRVEPLLASEWNEPVLDWGVAAQQEAILSFVRHLPAEVLAELSRPDWRDVFARLLVHFYQTPSQPEVQVFGSFPTAEDQNEVDWQPLARPYGLDALKRVLRAEPLYHHHNEWSAAARMMTPRPLYYSIRLIQKARCFLGS
jgi:hypothetical protein